jgi:hypothetical protein
VTAEWFGRDHVLVIQAASNLDAAPEFARQLWASAKAPDIAALQLIGALIHERAHHDD